MAKHPGKEQAARANETPQQKSLRSAVARVTADANGRVVIPWGNYGTNDRIGHRIFAGFLILFGAFPILISLVKGQGGAALLFGSPFILGALAILLYRNAFTADLNAQTWTHEVGVWPFLRRETGPLSEIEGMESLRLTREFARYQRASEYIDVYGIRLIWRDATRPPLELKAFDTLAASVGRAFALEQHGKLAQTIGLPLLADDAPALLTAPAADAPQFPTNAPHLSPLPIGALHLPPRPADSRLTVTPLPDGAEITLPRRGIALLVIPPLIILLFFGGFIVMAEISHRDFLQRVGPESREFFERSGSPATFFLPPALGFSALVAGVSYLAYRYNPAPRRLTLTPENLTLHFADAGKGGREQTLPWSELSAARVLQPGNAPSASVGGAGLEFSMQTGQTPAGAVVVYGPAIPDTTVSGGDLRAGDAAWLTALLQAAIHPATRAEAMAATLLLPTGAPPKKARTVTTLRANRATLISLALVGLTLLNSYGGGLTLLQTWDDVSGRRFLRSSNFWKTHTVWREPDGQWREWRASYTPFSSSTSGSRFPESEGTLASRWRLTLTGSAEAEMNAARR